MVRRAANLIREGLSSKVYLCAYPEYKTGYKIADELDVSANKVYHDVLKKHSELFDRKEGRPAPVKSRAEPLLREIEKAELSDPEREITLNILDSKEFRSFVGDAIKNTDFKDAVSATDKLMFWLSECAYVTVFPKKTAEKRSKPMKVKVTVKAGKLSQPTIDFIQFLFDTAPSSLLEKFLIAHPLKAYVVVSPSPETHPALRRLISKK